MKEDPSRKADITYNHLDLPEHISLPNDNGINYLFDASGDYHGQIKIENNSEVGSRHRVASVDYVDGIFDRLHASQGYIELEYGNGAIPLHDVRTGLETQGVKQAIKLESEATVPPTSNGVEYEAGGIIILRGGFSTQNNAEFKASIKSFSITGFRQAFTIKDHLGNTRVLFTADGPDSGSDPDVLSLHNYYPFGMEMDGPWQTSNQGDYNYLYNGKERQEYFEVGYLRYGRRFMDPTIGRWLGVDKFAELYTESSPYGYVMNTPINAIDPDGNVVIFINGLNVGGGGAGLSYWRSASIKGYSIAGPIYDYNNTNNFDEEVMNHFGDHNAIYIDGSPGKLWNNHSGRLRYLTGYDEGYNVAEAVISKLARDGEGNITETIKIITHSMGGVFGKGFVTGLKTFIRRSKDPKIRKALIKLVADFDPYEAGTVWGSGDPNIKTQQFIHKGMYNILGFGNMANQNEENAEDATESKNKSSHFISSFFLDIQNLTEGKYNWNKTSQKWECTNCKNQ